MSRPVALLVDDSEAVLAFERAALGGHFTLYTAADGREALERLESEVPDLLVLDLSMPHVNGEEVLARLTSDPRLSQVPVLVVSSETERAKASLSRGARAILPKPMRADELLAAALRLVDAQRDAARRAFLPCLPVRVGNLDVAVPLDAVEVVVPQVATTRVAFGPPYLREAFELHGDPVLSLDLAVRLGIEHDAPLVDRKLVVLRKQRVKVALCVDDVRDPVEIPPEDVLPGEQVGGATHGELRETLLALVRTERGAVPLVEPGAFLEPEPLDQLAEWLSARRGASKDVLQDPWD